MSNWIKAHFKPILGCPLAIALLVAGFVASHWLLVEPTVDFSFLDVKLFGERTWGQVFTTFEAAFFMFGAMFLAQKVYWRLIASEDLRQKLPMWKRVLFATSPICVVYLLIGLFGIGQKYQIFNLDTTLREAREGMIDIDRRFADVGNNFYYDYFNQMVWVLLGIAQVGILLGTIVQWKFFHFQLRPVAPDTVDTVELIVEPRASERVDYSLHNTFGDGGEGDDGETALRVVVPMPTDRGDGVAV